MEWTVPFWVWAVQFISWLVLFGSWLWMAHLLKKERERPDRIDQTIGHYDRHGFEYAFGACPLCIIEKKQGYVEERR